MKAAYDIHSSPLEILAKKMSRLSCEDDRRILPENNASYITCVQISRDIPRARNIQSKGTDGSQVT